MTERTRTRRWLRRIGIALVGLMVIFVVALFIIDRRLNPPVDEPDLGPIAVPTGAPLDSELVVYDSDQSGTFEVWTMGFDGSNPQQLTDDPSFDSWWARISPDRSTILFYRTPAGVHDRDFEKTSLWMIGADGSGLVEVLPIGSHGWNQHGHAEWSPDGTQLTMFGGKNTNPHIWVTDATGRNPVDIADDQGTNLDPSWSIDGSTVVYVGCPGRVCLPSAQEIYTVPATGGDRVRLTNDGVRDHDPYYSPDGSTIALLSQTSKPAEAIPAGSWNIRAVAPSGGETWMVTDNPEINSMPKWLSNSEIIFHRLDYGSTLGFDLAVVDVNTGVITTVLQTASNEEYPDPGFRPRNS